MGLFPFLFIVLLTFGHAADVKGAIDLDSVSFPKIVGSSHFDVLVKFDKSYPYGDKEDQYKEFVKTIGQAPGLNTVLVANVGVEDYGDKKNDDLREQFGINADDFPVFRLFPRASTVPIPFTATVTASNLLLFVKQTLGVWIGLPGCLERYDSLTDGFLSLEESQKTEKVAAAEDLLAKEEADADKKTASFYVEMMKNVVKEGNGAVAKATKAIEEEAGDDKDWKQNVLASLTKYRCKSGHTGCLKAMDAVAETFLAASVEERAGLLKKVQALDFSKDEADQESAKVYLGIFKRIVDKGTGYVESETARLNKLLGSQISDNKKKQFQFKLTILGAFGSSA
jgi:endoplasmic reticulum protein 29